MPPPAGTLRVGRYFLALLVIVAVLYGIVFWPGQRHTSQAGARSRRWHPGRLPGPDGQRQNPVQVVDAGGSANSPGACQRLRRRRVDRGDSGERPDRHLHPRQERERHLEHRRCGQTELPAGRHATGDAARAPGTSGAPTASPSGATTAPAPTPTTSAPQASGSATKSGQANAARPLAAPSTTPTSSATTSPAKSATLHAVRVRAGTDAKSADPLGRLEIRDSAERDAYNKLTRRAARPSCGRPCRTSTATPSRRTTTNTPRCWRVTARPRPPRSSCSGRSSSPVRRSPPPAPRRPTAPICSGPCR